MTSFLLVTLAQVACTDGQLISPDSAGHCCWPGQAWSHSREVCVGIPTCAAGQRVEGERCVVECAPGQLVGPDTAGKCCWPNQVWSTSRAACVGVPSCATGFAVSGDQCVAPGPAPAAARSSGECASDRDCPGALVCEAQRCVAEVSATPLAPVSAPVVKTPVEPPSRGPPWYLFVGAGAFLAGYLPTIIGPAAAGNYSAELSRRGPIPIAGPFLMRDAVNDFLAYERGLSALAFVAFGLQVVGLAGLGAGIAVWIQRLLAPAQTGSDDVTPVVTLSPAAGGLVLQW